MAMSPKMRLFALEYVTDRNATQAAIRAGYSPKSAHVTAHRMLKDPKVIAIIAPFLAPEVTREELAAATAKGVQRGIEAVASADARELVEYRRHCCRYCYGHDNRFQFTRGEMERRRMEHNVLLAKTPETKWKTLPEFDEMGGTGYDKRKDPSPDCMECFGEGEGTVYLHDTRTLGEAAAIAYAGVKVTKDGLQMLIHDRVKGLELAGRMRQMFGDRAPVDEDGNPVETVSNTFVAVYVAPKGEG